MTSRIDNLVITSSDLDAAALRLAQWKNSTGIPSKVMNVEWINYTYSGVDEPEKIRNCIKDYYVNSQIKYVTIFGDADKVPTRYVYVNDGEENFTATDLYYAALNGNWDDNHDGMYGDPRYDNVDCVPQVGIGRIPADTIDSAQAVVDKMENYRQQFDVSQDWTRRIVLVAGTGNNGEGDNQGTGPTDLNEYIANVAHDKESIKLYEKAGNLSTASLASSINDGALFVNFAGHGSPGSTSWWDAGGWLLTWDWIPLLWEGFSIVNIQSTTNGAKLPVVTACSCSTARFDDTDCMGEEFVLDPTGGAIAYFGSTRVSYGTSPNGDSAGHLYRTIYEKFYAGFACLGQMWQETVRDYAHAYVQHYQTAYWWESLTMLEFVLLGDPTLRIYNGPETLRVPEDYATVQGAINAAFPGDTVYVYNGTYSENIIVNKTISLVGQNRATTILDGGSISVTASGVVISNFTIRDSSYACVALFNTYDCNISGNIFDSSYEGILLSNSSYSQVRDNSMTNCSYGIFLDYFSCFNNVTYNEISKSNNGVCLSGWCYGNLVSQNNIADNYRYGLFMANSTFNRVSDNTIARNRFGIVLDFSVNNTVYHNNFMSNIQQATVDPTNSMANQWDNSYPSCGNYWSDYGGIDLHSGRYQNETGTDGIGDTPYVIDEKNRDRWPFMNPYQIRDIALVNVSISGTSTFPFWPPWLPQYPIVLPPYRLYINATVENRGNKTETFIVHVYANSKVIGNIPVVLPPFATETFGIEWNATDFAGEYMISTYTEPLPGEEDIINNNFTYGNLWVLHADIAITGTTTCKDGCIPLATLCRGYTAHVNVTVLNKGDLTEDFNVTVYANSMTIGTQTVLSLAPDNQTVLTFLWNASGCAIGNYTITAYATPVTGETDATNNNYTGGVVKVTTPGDINGDDRVDMKDISIPARALLAVPGTTLYNPNADITDDHRIDMKDIAVVAKHFYEHYP